MSAFVVSREHINYLVNAARTRGMGRDQGSMSWYWKGKDNMNRSNASGENGMYETEIGQMLWDENIKSIHARYPDTTEHPENMPGPIGENFVFSFRHDSQEINPVQVIKLCHSYSYQSCEHEEWETSEAKGFIEALEHRAIFALPGYDEAEWEI